MHLHLSILRKVVTRPRSNVTTIAMIDSKLEDDLVVTRPRSNVTTM